MASGFLCSDDVVSLLVRSFSLSVASLLLVSSFFLSVSSLSSCCLFPSFSLSFSFSLLATAATPASKEGAVFGKGASFFSVTFLLGISRRPWGASLTFFLVVSGEVGAATDGVSCRSASIMAFRFIVPLSKPGRGANASIKLLLDLASRSDFERTRPFFFAASAIFFLPV